MIRRRGPYIYADGPGRRQLSRLTVAAVKSAQRLIATWHPYVDGLAVGLVKNYADGSTVGIGVPRGDQPLL